MHEAKQPFEAIGNEARVSKDFHDRTRKSGSRARRVIGKSKHLSKDGSPRFVVTSLSMDRSNMVTICEKGYGARGDLENRIKEQLLYVVC